MSLRRTSISFLMSELIPLILFSFPLNFTNYWVNININIYENGLLCKREKRGGIKHQYKLSQQNIFFSEIPPLLMWSVSLRQIRDGQHAFCYLSLRWPLLILFSFYQFVVESVISSCLNLQLFLYLQLSFGNILRLFGVMLW